MLHTEYKTIGVCDTQPVTTEGLKAILSEQEDLQFLAGAHSLNEVNDLIRNRRPDIVIMDKSFGIQAVLDWVTHLKAGAYHATEVVIWGVSVTEAEALRFLQTGARGITRKSTDIDTLLSCLRTVAAGSSWMAECVFRESSRVDRYSKSELTPREQQVMELVEQGLKNKEIAKELGIRPGTVKIHLKHIFEKTGVRGRYGLALSVMRQKGTIALAPVAH
jgi:DNA-binding NarL/FixJ family response regulator